MKELTTDEIVEVNGEKWIIAKCHKTDVPLQVKLLDIPLQIIERYRPMQKDDLLFPDLNYRTVCKPLKKMIKECGSNKNINFQSAGRLRFMAKCRPLRVYLRNTGGRLTVAISFGQQTCQSWNALHHLQTMIGFLLRIAIENLCLLFGRAAEQPGFRPPDCIVTTIAPVLGGGNLCHNL